MFFSGAAKVNKKDHTVTNRQTEFAVKANLPGVGSMSYKSATQSQSVANTNSEIHLQVGNKKAFDTQDAFFRQHNIGPRSRVQELPADLPPPYEEDVVSTHVKGSGQYHLGLESKVQELPVALPTADEEVAWPSIQDAFQDQALTDHNVPWPSLKE